MILEDSQLEEPSRQWYCKFCRKGAIKISNRIAKLETTVESICKGKYTDVMTKTIESTCSALVKKDEKNHNANSHEVDIKKVVAEELSEANDRRNKRCNLVIFNISEDKDHVELRKQKFNRCQSESEVAQYIIGNVLNIKEHIE